MSEVKSIKELIKDIDGLRTRDIPYIAMIATNNIAFDTKQTIDKEIGGKLNIRKKRLTTSVRVKKASKSNPYAKVFIDENSWQHDTLKHHFFGGDRDRKGLEKSLMRFGFMSSDEILTPPPGVTIRPSTYVKMISQLKLVYKSGYAANETKKSRFRNKTKRKERYFVIGTYERSHLHPGIYVRMPDHDKPINIMRIAKKPNYKDRLKDFDETVEEIFDKKSEMHLGKAMDYVLKKNKDMGWV